MYVDFKELTNLFKTDKIDYPIIYWTFFSLLFTDLNVKTSENYYYAK